MDNKCIASGWPLRQTGRHPQIALFGDFRALYIQQAEIMLTPCSIKKNGYEPKILSLEQRLAADVMIASFQNGNLKIMSQQKMLIAEN